MEHFVSSLSLDTKVSGIVKTPTTDNLFSTRQTEFFDEKKQIEFHYQVVWSTLLNLAKRTVQTFNYPLDNKSSETRYRWQILSRTQWFKRFRHHPQSWESPQTSCLYRYILRCACRWEESFGISSHTWPRRSVLAKSSKHKLVTESSTAEWVTESDFASEVIHGTEFLLAQGEDITPQIIHQDYMSMISTMKNDISKSDKTRHTSMFDSFGQKNQTVKFKSYTLRRTIWSRIFWQSYYEEISSSHSFVACPELEQSKLYSSIYHTCSSTMRPMTNNMLNVIDNRQCRRFRDVYDSCICINDIDIFRAYLNTFSHRNHLFTYGPSSWYSSRSTWSCSE